MHTKGNEDHNFSCAKYVARGIKFKKRNATCSILPSFFLSFFLWLLLLLMGSGARSNATSCVMMARFKRAAAPGGRILFTSAASSKSSSCGPVQEPDETAGIAFADAEGTTETVRTSSYVRATRSHCC